MPLRECILNFPQPTPAPSGYICIIMKIAVVLLVAAVLLAGAFSSCRHYTSPPDTKDSCDTCHKKCDTCKTDTTKPPCDTCNIDKDSAAHAFVWTEYNVPGETNITGVWVFGPNDIILNGGTLWHFDGANFTKIDARNATHNNASMSGVLSGSSIFAFTQTEFWIVRSAIAYHTIDGQYFDDYRPGSVNACWGSAPNDVFFVGNNGHITYFDGTKFEDMISGTTKDLRSVWGTNHNDIWAGGSNLTTGAVVLLHFDGTQWTEIDLSTVGEFGCAGCESVASVWVVDSSNHSKAFVGGGRIHRQKNNLDWIADDPNQVGNKLSGNSFISLSSISGNSSTDFMTAGDWGFVSHWNGKTWMRYNNLFNSGNSNYATQAFQFSGNTACIVGFKNGPSWVAVGRRK